MSVTGELLAKRGGDYRGDYRKVNRRLSLPRSLAPEFCNCFLGPRGRLTPDPGLG